MPCKQQYLIVQKGLWTIQVSWQYEMAEKEKLLECRPVVTADQQYPLILGIGTFENLPNTILLVVSLVIPAVSGTIILYWATWSKLLDRRALSIDILQNNIAAASWKCIAFLKIDHRIIYKQSGVKPGTYGMGENIRNAP